MLSFSFLRLRYLITGSLFLFITFNYFTQPPPIPLPIPPPTSPLATTSLFSVLSLAFLCLFICLFWFFDSTYRGHHMVFAFLCQTLFLIVIVSHQQTQAPLTIEARQSRDIPCADRTHPPTLVRLCPHPGCLC